MKLLAFALVTTSLVAQDVTVSRSGSQPSSPGDARYFTGSVRVELLAPAGEPSRLSGARVTFEPGAHTAWHTHPADANCYSGHRLGAAMGRFRRGDAGRRCGPNPGRREALARRHRHHSHDAHRPYRGVEPESRKLDGEGQRRTVSEALNKGRDSHARNSSIWPPRRAVRRAGGSNNH